MTILPTGYKHWNSDVRIVCTEKGTMLKNKNPLFKRPESMLVHI